MFRKEAERNANSIDITTIITRQHILREIIGSGTGKGNYHYLYKEKNIISVISHH